MLHLNKAAMTWILETGQFDPDWYRAAFPDVDVLGMKPLDHFRKYGRLMGRAPNARLAEDPSLLTAVALPAPKPGAALAEAFRLCATKGSDIGLAYARLHLPDAQAHMVRTLQANQALAAGDRQGWLRHVNAYLDHFGLAPIVLGAEGALIEQLRTPSLPALSEGPMVSVIMPAWNAENSLAAAAGSILGQTWRNLELLIVDDASTDGTWAVMQDLAARDDRVRIWRNSQNVGPYVSKNIALTQARGEWITGHDADDWAHPERIARQVAFSEGSGQPATLAGMARISPEGAFVRVNRIGTNVHDGICRSAFISLMVQREFFKERLGFWDSVRVAGDSELIGRIQTILGRRVPRLDTITMLCFDNPDGLTNSPGLAYSEAGKVSPARLAYKAAFDAYHADRTAARLKPYAIDRVAFASPPKLQVPSEVLDAVIASHAQNGAAPRKSLRADVVIITNLRFPGGNASSTLDEITYLADRGLSVTVIHCPIPQSIGRPISARYRDHADKIVHADSIETITAKVAICRHPRVMTSPAFAKLQSALKVEDCFIVKNNSRRRPNGDPVYDIGQMIEAAGRIAAERLTFCPISPLMRQELEEHCRATATRITIAPRDWTPTFALEDYRHPPKPVMAAPFRIGRHSRDGSEKWHEDPATLARIYPADPDFRIEILGGADHAARILGGLPANWRVAAFGSESPRDYLARLDAFVYYPNTGLVEGFGRTVVEAMLAGIPVILPPHFGLTFGDLPLYSEPDQVEALIRRLARAPDVDRIGYLTEVQQIAMARFSSPVILQRLTGTPLAPGTAEGVATIPDGLGAASQRFRTVIMTMTAQPA